MELNEPISRFLADEEKTLALAKSWALTLNAPLVVYLEGDLGAGKTTFTRGLLNGLGYQGVVKSPTYAIVESYSLSLFTLHHFDLYRFSSPDEWQDAGLDDLFHQQSICLIEWPQQGGEFVPQTDVTISLAHAQSGRVCTLTSHTIEGQQSLQAWLN